MSSNDEPREEKEPPPADPLNALPSSARRRLAYGMEGHENPPPGTRER